MTDELAGECDRIPRLKQHFGWVQDPPHPENRRKWRYTPSREQAAQVKSERVDFLRAASDILIEETAKKRARGYSSALSPVDESVLCIANSLGLGVVTDERPMTMVCREFDIEHFTTLEALKQLHSDEVLQLSQIDSLVQYWQYEKDVPHRHWARDYESLFGTPPTLLRF